MCKQHAQQNKLDSILCTAILGFSGNLGQTLGLWPRVILECQRQPRLFMCRGGYLLRVSLYALLQLYGHGNMSFELVAWQAAVWGLGLHIE